MPQIGQDITHWQGDTRFIKIRVDDGNGGPVDLTGASARWWLGKNAKATGTDVFVKKSTHPSEGISLISDTNGFWTIVVQLLSPDTQGPAVPAGRWYHEAEVIRTGGEVARVALGKFLLNPSMIPAALGP